MKRHVTCFAEKAWFEPRTLSTKADRYDHCATRPGKFSKYINKKNPHLSKKILQCAKHLTG